MFGFLDFTVTTAVRIYREFTYYKDFSECKYRLTIYTDKCSAVVLHKLFKQHKQRLNSQEEICKNCSCRLACAFGSTPVSKYYDKNLSRIAQTTLHDRIITSRRNP